MAYNNIEVDLIFTVTPKNNQRINHRDSQGKISYAWQFVKSLFFCLKPMSSPKMLFEMSLSTFSKTPVSVHWKGANNFPSFQEVVLRCVALQATSFSQLLWKIQSHTFSAVFPRSLDPACISACFFRKQISCSRFSDSTTEHFTRRSECETSLDQYRNRPGR